MATAKINGLSILDLVTGAWIYFDTYFENKFSNDNNVAFEVLENGSFSSDSKQNTPAIVSIIGGKAIEPSNSNNRQDVDSFKQILQALAASDHLVDIYLNTKYQQYNNVYKSYTLKTFNFEQTPEQLELQAQMTFQEIRITSVEFTTITQDVAKPVDKPIQNKGQVQPEQTSWLKYLTSPSNFAKFLG